MAYAARGKPLVLVVEPEPADQQAVGASLIQSYQVKMVQTQAEAIRQLVLLRPSFLVLEMTLPDGDGPTLIRHVREDAVLHSMVIVCLTRRAGIRDKVTGLQAGADDYVIKPINAELFPFKLRLLARMRQLTFS